MVWKRFLIELTVEITLSHNESLVPYNETLHEYASIHSC